MKKSFKSFLPDTDRSDTYKTPRFGKESNSFFNVMYRFFEMEKDKFPELEKTKIINRITVLDEIMSLSDKKTSLFESLQNFRRQRSKYLEWKESGKIPPRINCKFDNYTKTINLVDSKPFYSPIFTLANIKNNTELEFWCCDEVSANVFLLYKHKVIYCEKLQKKGVKGIVHDISPFFCLGLNYVKQKDGTYYLFVHNGSPADVRHRVDKQLQNDLFDLEYGEDTISEILHRVANMTCKNFRGFGSKIKVIFKDLTDTLISPRYAYHQILRALKTPFRYELAGLISILLALSILFPYLIDFKMQSILEIENTDCLTIQYQEFKTKPEQTEALKPESDQVIYSTPVLINVKGNHGTTNTNNKDLKKRVYNNKLNKNFNQKSAGKEINNLQSSIVITSNNNLFTGITAQEFI